VRIFNGRTGIREDGFLAYRRGFENGVGVAVLDVNGDGIDEIVTSPLDGATRVKVFRGDGKLAKGFRAYAPNFAGGAFVAGA
jgi:hypothetical protein